MQVPENVPDFLVTTVFALDRDSTPSVTYAILSGDRSLFKIDPETGVIR